MKTIICDVTGSEAPQEQFYKEEPCPVNWIEVRVSRVFANPDYLAIQQAQIQATAQMLARIPEDQRTPEAVAQVEAAVATQYRPFLAIIPRIAKEERVRYISPPEEDSSVLEMIEPFFEALSIDDLILDTATDSDEGA